MAFPGPLATSLDSLTLLTTSAVGRMPGFPYHAMLWAALQRCGVESLRVRQGPGSGGVGAEAYVAAVLPALHRLVSAALGQWEGGGAGAVTALPPVLFSLAECCQCPSLAGVTSLLQAACLLGDPTTLTLLLSSAGGVGAVAGAAPSCHALAAQVEAVTAAGMGCASVKSLAAAAVWLLGRGAGAGGRWERGVMTASCRWLPPPP